MIDRHFFKLSKRSKGEEISEKLKAEGNDEMEKRIIISFPNTPQARTRSLS